MLSIGEFSQLCHISTRMLRHYDALDLLRPAHTDQQTGYRNYDESQLQGIQLIEKLKGYGFSLAEIKALLTLSEQELADRVHKKMLEQYEQLNELRKIVRKMEDEIFRMEGDQLMREKYKVTVTNHPAQKVFGIRKTINVGQVNDLFEEVLAEIQKRGIKIVGASQMQYLGDEFSYEHMDVEAQYQVTGEHPDIKEISEQLCVSAMHSGPYDGLKNAYDAICAWLAEHPEYEVTGGSVERYIKDVDHVNSPEEYETCVFFPVMKK
jgi:DNA-binding transcriptional MerR regulator